MSENQRKYDAEYKVQAVKLSNEIGSVKAANELGIPANTLYGWQRAVREGRLNIGPGAYTPDRYELSRIAQYAAAESKSFGEGKPSSQRRTGNISGSDSFFRSQPLEVRKDQRMIFAELKTENGAVNGKLSLYCRVLGISRQGFYKQLAVKERPWKYQPLADLINEIISEDECKDTYGRVRMYQALLLKNPDIPIPSERTVYRIMSKMGVAHLSNRKPNGITKADREARKSDDLLRRDFCSDKPCKKCVTDIT